MNKTLTKILLSENVVEEFHKHYEQPEFKQWILSVLPEIENCKNTKQDNPWHIYNCLDHILHSVENINKQSVGLDDQTRKQLAYVMFFHDIGKPECVSRRFSKLYGREVDSFFYHNKASVKVATRVLSQLGFTPEEVEEMKLLIDQHDIFMFIRMEQPQNEHHKQLTEDLIRQYISEYNEVGNGVQLLDYLIMVGRADSLAQNPQMTQYSLELLDKMEEMLIGIKCNKI